MPSSYLEYSVSAYIFPDQSAHYGLILSASYHAVFPFTAQTKEPGTFIYTRVTGAPPIRF